MEVELLDNDETWKPSIYYKQEVIEKYKRITSTNNYDYYYNDTVDLLYRIKKEE